MPERTFWLAFERERPRILGALFDMVAHGLRELPNIHLETLPRLADFALWITACEGAAWPKGAFLDAFEANRRGPVDTVLEAAAVASAVRALMATRDSWAGTASGCSALSPSTSTTRPAVAKPGRQRRGRCPLGCDEPRPFCGRSA